MVLPNIHVDNKPAWVPPSANTGGVSALDEKTEKETIGERLYIQAELKRVEKQMRKYAAKLSPPERRKYRPYMFHSFYPYRDTTAIKFLFDLPDFMKYGFVSRETAFSPCDPWINLNMDKPLPKIPDKPGMPPHSPFKYHIHHSQDHLQPDKHYQEFGTRVEDFRLWQLEQMAKYSPHHQGRLRQIHTAYLTATGKLEALQNKIKRMEAEMKRHKRPILPVIK